MERKILALTAHTTVFVKMFKSHEILFQNEFCCYHVGGLSSETGVRYGSLGIILVWLCAAGFKD